MEFENWRTNALRPGLYQRKEELHIEKDLQHRRKKRACNAVDYDTMLCSIPLGKASTFYTAISPHHTQITFAHALNAG